MDRTVSLHFQEICLDSILSLPQNKYCADCKLQAPDWVSLSYGVFICYKCSGIHRSLGVQRTRVKSIKLDTWTLKQLFFMAYVNNENSNEYWEALLPENFHRPDPASTREMTLFVTSKYVDGMYIDPLKKSPIKEANEKLNEENGSKENLDPEVVFKTKQDELKRFLKLKIVSSKSSTNLSQSLETSKIRSPDSLATKSENKKTSGLQRKRLPFASPSNIGGRLKFSFNLESAASNSVKEDSLTNSQGSLDAFPLFEGLTIKSPNSNTKFPKGHPGSHPSKLFFFSDDHHSGISSQVSFNESKSPIHSIESIEFKEFKPAESHSADEKQTPKSKVHKKSQFARKPSIEVEMENWSCKEKTGHQDATTQNEFKEYLEDMILLKISPIEERADSSRLSFSKFGSAERQLERHESITVTLKEAQKQVSHLKRPSEAFIPSQTNLDEVKGFGLFGTKGEKGRKIMVILDCVLIHMLLGYIFSWGAIAPYINSYVSNRQEDYLQFCSWNLLLFLGMAFGYRISERAVNVFGMKKVCFYSFIFLSSLLFISSFSTNLFISVILMTLLPGFFIGVIYQIPFFCAIQYFHHQTKILKQLFPIANGLGAFFFINLFPLILSHAGISGPSQTSEGFYTQEIVSYIPTLIKTIAFTIFILSLVANFFLRPKVNFVEKDWAKWGEKEEGLLSNERSFYIVYSRSQSEAFDNVHIQDPVIPRSLLGISTFFFTLGGLLLYSYKIIGFQYSFSDTTLCLIGGFGMLTLAIGRALGITFYQKLGFKPGLKIIIPIQGIMGLLSFFFEGNRNFFVVSFLGIMLFSGVGFSMLMQEGLSMSHNQEQALMGGFVILGFALSNFLGYILVKMLALWEVFNWFYLVNTIPLIIAFGILFYYPENMVYSKKLTTNSATRSTLRL